MAPRTLDKPIPVRLPRPLTVALDEAARLTGQSRSAVLRELLVDALTRRGAWPPTAEAA